MIILKHIFFRKKYFTLLKNHVVRHIQGVHVVTTIFLVKYKEKILSMVQNELHIHENIFSLPKSLEPSYLICGDIPLVISKL